MSLIQEVETQIARPFSEKLLKTQGLIAHNLMLYKDKIAVAFSGGKDSLVVLYLARQLQSDLKVVFNNTGVEYPETRVFIEQLHQDWNLNLITTKPVKTFWECIDEYGFVVSKWGNRHKSNHHCCYWLKEKPMKQIIKELYLEAMLTGMTASESRNRMFTARDYGDCYYSVSWKIQRIHPILWWTENEVRQFILDMHISNNPLYARGMNRIGCMPCTAYKSWEEQLRKFNPKLYEIIKLRKDSQYILPFEDLQEVLI